MESAQIAPLADDSYECSDAAVSGEDGRVGELGRIDSAAAARLCSS